MNSPQALKFEDFPNPPIFDELGKSNQVKYLKNYLKDLGAFAHIPFSRRIDEIIQHDIIKKIIPDHKVKFGTHVPIWNTEST